MLEAFAKYAQVKDIRMIKDKSTGEFRDFAFIEFFTLTDSAYVVESTKNDPLSINGQPVTVSYSKLKRNELPAVHRA